MQNQTVMITKLSSTQFPPQLLESPEPPKNLYLRGPLPSPEIKLLTVVGSRRCTNYGQQACEKIINELKGSPVAIVSGLALGIDAIAHRAALNAKLHTIAVPGSGIADSVLYPRSNFSLAQDIIAAGGTLLSEYEPEFKATKWSFPKRNRIMAALSHAVLIIEAEPRSGTLITARLALDYNKELLAVPGSIFSNTSQGTNALLRDGATPIQSGADILEQFGILSTTQPTQQKLIPDNCSDNELIILEALCEPMDKTSLLLKTKLSAEVMASSITLLEIKGHIKEQMGKLFRTK